METIKWTSGALKKYLETLEFWIEHNQSINYAQKISIKTDEILQLLVKNPQMGVKLTKNENIRKVLILKKFNLYYQFTENQIQILAFTSTSENTDKLKF